jgi:two-component sensor histidine kinase
MTTAIIGDVHGALQPLEALIARLGLGERDRLVLLGDLVDKGPDPAGTVKFVRQLSETAPFDLVLVEGNHEDRHRRYHQNLTERPKIARQMAEAAPDLAALDAQLSPADRAFLARAVPFLFQRKALRTLARQVMRERDLRLALKNQKILRNEMDHRVKNSLQSVASLVRLYRSRVDPQEDAFTAFDAIGRRLEATAALHQMLHESPLEGAVMMDAFLAEVTSLLQDSAPDHVALSCEAPAIALPTSLASAIAVITSEFVANSIKHAFGDATPGTVRITGSGGGKEGLRIVCEDNGKAAERAAPNAKSVEGLGKRIMEASAAQIGATLEQGPGGEGYRMVLALPATGNC